MPASRHFDTVVYDVREISKFLFFAKTKDDGDIEDYLMIVRTDDPEFEDIVIIETNEEQVVNGEGVVSASLGPGMLTLTFGEPVSALDGESVITLTFDDTDDNRRAIEDGAFQVLGDQLTGGHA